MDKRLNIESCLPDDRERAVLIGRAWVPAYEGPALVSLHDDGVYDISRVAATASALFDLDDPPAVIRAASDLPRLASVSEMLANSAWNRRNNDAPWFLAPCDLQAIKASGVTFVSSMLERVIEEQARGDARKAESVRQAIVAIIGSNLRSIRPGSEAARAVKHALIAQGAWSQYLEVGIGPD